MMRICLIFMLPIFFSGCCNSFKDKAVDTSATVIRKGAMIKIKPEQLNFYLELHANPWPSVNEKLKECNIQNYSIYYREGYLFSYLEYTGNNWDEDMKKLAADSSIQAWWKLTDPCQEPMPFATQGEWWSDMEEIYHLQ